MSVSETIKKKLISEFKPQELEVIDESHMHAGHVEQDQRVRRISDW